MGYGKTAGRRCANADSGKEATVNPARRLLDQPFDSEVPSLQKDNLLGSAEVVGFFHTRDFGKAKQTAALTRSKEVPAMNRIHHWLCRSARWRRELEENVMPWVLNGVELGTGVLEVGPGPGLTTDILRPRIAHLTALEIDSALALSLAARMQGSNVTVIQGDATDMPFPDAEFTGAVCFTMLHHVPSLPLQDRLFREVFRVLKPGAMFAGVDGRTSLYMRLIHIYDTLVPIEPSTFRPRLEHAGFEEIFIEAKPQRFRFQARKPVSKD
jgi:SAM-dependent methyltransferase